MPSFTIDCSKNTAKPKFAIPQGILIVSQESYSAQKGNATAASIAKDGPVAFVKCFPPMPN